MTSLRVILVASAIFCFAAVAAFWHDKNINLVDQQYLPQPIEYHIPVDSMSLVKFSGKEYKGAMSVVIPASPFSGSFLLHVTFPVSETLYVQDEVGKQELNANARNCVPSDDSLRCSLLYDYEYPAGSKIVISTLNKDINIQKIEIENIRKNLRIWGEESRVLSILMTFGVFALFIGMFSSIRVKRNLTLIASLSFIAALSWSLLYFTLIYLTASYFFIRLLRGGHICLATSIVTQVMVILSFKILLPVSGLDVFSNGILLPLGISYLFLRQIDLQIKITRGQVTECGFFEFIEYNLFWPAFSAGPIMEYSDFYLARGKVKSCDRWKGLERFSVGIAKKAFSDLIMLIYYLPMFTAFLTEQSTNSTLFGVLAVNLVYVYLDFSAYSDMAIGSGKLMGVRVPENFNFPIFKPGMRAFWQNWHITLSRWVSRNVFIPLSLILRHEHLPVRYFLPLAASVGTIGLWHSLSITWILWSMHHAVGIILTDIAANLSRSVRSRFHIEYSRLWGNASAAIGILFVWFWLMLSFCFTLTNNYEIAIEWYLSAWKLAYETTIGVLS